MPSQKIVIFSEAKKNKNKIIINKIKMYIVLPCIYVISISLQFFRVHLFNKQLVHSIPEQIVGYSRLRSVQTRLCSD